MVELIYADCKSPLQAEPQIFSNCHSNLSQQGLIAKFHAAINDATEREYHFLNPSTYGGWN